MRGRGAGVGGGGLGVCAGGADANGGVGGEVRGGVAEGGAGAADTSEAENILVNSPGSSRSIALASRACSISRSVRAGGADTGGAGRGGDGGAAGCDGITGTLISWVGAENSSAGVGGGGWIAGVEDATGAGPSCAAFHIEENDGSLGGSEAITAELGGPVTGVATGSGAMLGLVTTPAESISALNPAIRASSHVSSDVNPGRKWVTTTVVPSTCVASMIFERSAASSRLRLTNNA